jgi:uncharacterized protein YjiK
VVSDAGNHRIVWLDKSGATVKIVEGFHEPNGIAVLGDGGVVFSDFGNSRVVWLDKSGAIVKTVGGFNQVCGLTTPIGVTAPEFC